MNEGEVIEEEAVFKRPSEEMKRHLKPLYIWAKVEDVGVNKVLIDGGETINLMPSTLLKQLGKSTTDLKPHNMVLSQHWELSCSQFVWEQWFDELCLWWSLLRPITIFSWVENGSMVLEQ